MKKAVAFWLALCVLLTLAACGSETDSDEPADDPLQQETEDDNNIADPDTADYTELMTGIAKLGRLEDISDDDILRFLALIPSNFGFDSAAELDSDQLTDIFRWTREAIYAPEAFSDEWFVPTGNLTQEQRQDGWFNSEDYYAIPQAAVATLLNQILEGHTFIPEEVTETTFPFSSIMKQAYLPDEHTFHISYFPHHSGTAKLIERSEISSGVWRIKLETFNRGGMRGTEREYVIKSKSDGFAILSAATLFSSEYLGFKLDDQVDLNDRDIVRSVFISPLYEMGRTLNYDWASPSDIDVSDLLLICGMMNYFNMPQYSEGMYTDPYVPAYLVEGVMHERFGVAAEYLRTYWYYKWETEDDVYLLSGAGGGGGRDFVSLSVERDGDAVTINVGLTEWNTERELKEGESRPDWLSGDILLGHFATLTVEIRDGYFKYISYFLTGEI